MSTFEFDIGEQSRVGSRFLEDIRDELQRALSIEKTKRKITQQQIAEKLGTSRAVINRQLMGHENMSIRRVAEILWAIGWEPFFKARAIPVGHNHYVTSPLPLPDQPSADTTQGTIDLTPTPQPDALAA